MDRPALPVTGLDLSSQPTTTNNSPQPAGVEEKIPRMTNIAPSIFVPLEIDITQPIEPARDRAEKLQRILAAAEGRRKGVTENIIYMTEREMARIRQEGRTYEAIHGPPAGPRPSMTEKEVDDMMANIAADAPPGKSLARVNLADIEIKFPEQMSQREAVAAELLKRRRAIDAEFGGVFGTDGNEKGGVATDAAEGTGEARQHWKEARGAGGRSGRRCRDVLVRS